MFRRFGFIVAAALLAAVPAAAQDVKPVQINVGGGYTGVYGAGKDHVGDGGNFTLGVIFHTKSAVSIQGEYGWNGMKQKQLSLPVYGTPGGSAGVPTDFFADANILSSACAIGIAGFLSPAFILWKRTGLMRATT